MSLPDDFRAKARANVDGSIALFEAPDFATNPKKQAMAIIGQVNGTVYAALADAVDYLRGSGNADRLVSQMSAAAKRNHALRMAAAKGDWDEFNRLVNDGSDGSGSSGAAQPDPAAQSQPEGPGGTGGTDGTTAAP